MAVPSAASVTTTAISNVFASVSANATYSAQNGLAIRQSNEIYIYEATHDTDTAADFKSWLATIGAMVCYPLATPTTVQLTAQNVKTLLGDNSIWADSGDIDVVIRADTAKYIANQIANALNA